MSVSRLIKQIVIFCFILPSVSHGVDFKPATSINNRHQCEYSNDWYLHISKYYGIVVGADDYDRDSDKWLTKDEAFQRYGSAPYSVEMIEKLGFDVVSKTRTHYFAKKQDDYETHWVDFNADLGVLFTKKVGQGLELAAYNCSDVMANRIPSDTFAYIDDNVSSISLMLTDFIPQQFHQYKFDISCFDDWDEVLFTHLKARGSTESNAFINEDDESLLVPSIRIDDSQLTLKRKLVQFNKFVEVCKLTSVEARFDEKARRDFDERIADKKLKQLEFEKELENKAKAANELINAQKEEQKIENDKNRVPEIMSDIGSMIRDKWIRPYSLRDEMFLTLELKLISDGSIVSAKIVESNADQAFEKSIRLALGRVRSFQIVTELHPEVFEENFSSFKLVFKP